MTAGKVARWPLLVIAAPASVAVWSGWVGLGSMCGFGLVQPLPGMAPWHLDTAITLPVGIEAYGTYALGAWVKLAGSSGPAAARAASFAKRSSIGALVLGMTGQVIYHLLAAAHATRAPWPVVMLVACLPVVSLGFGAALIHLSRAAGDEIEQEQADREEVRAERQSRRRTAATPDTALAPYGPPAVLPPYGPTPDAPPRTGAGTDAAQPVRNGSAGTGRPGSGIDREGLIAELAAQIVADPDWRPDYGALQKRTGCRRSYCEKLVREARQLAAASAPEPVRGAP